MTAGSRSRDWLSVHDLAERFGISRSAAYRLGRRIPAYRIPGIGLRFLATDVDTFLEAYRREPGTSTGRGRSNLRSGMTLADPRAVVPGDDQELAQLLKSAGLKLKEN